MRVINAFEESILKIGYQGENERTHVLFDIRDWIEEYGTGTVVLLVARPFETEASPVLCTETEPGIYDWEVTESDLAVRGDGEAQLAFTPDGSLIAKTHIWGTLIDRSLSETENPPAPWAGWVASVIAAAQAAVEAEEAVPETVRQALQEAKDSGEFDGTGIESISQNADYTLTIHLTDGTEYTTSPVRGEKGDKGDTGNGIASVQLNQDYTLTVNFTDGTSWTTPVSIRGEKGDIGLTPDMQIGTVQTLAPGSSATASVTGTPEHPLLNLGIPQGQQGVKGDTGNGIASISLNQDYTLTINYTDGTHDTTPSIRGEKGDTGATPNISIGTVTTVSPTTPASATMTGTPENPVLNLNIPQGVPGEVTKAQLDTKAPVLIGEAEGGIATLLDGADNMPFKNIWAEFLPAQSGSGDPSPTNRRQFIAKTGLTLFRSGKNILKNDVASGSENGITWTANDDGSVTLSGTATANVFIYFRANASANTYPVAYGHADLVCSGRASYNPSIDGVRFQNDIYVDGVYTRTLQTGSPAYSFDGGVIAIRTSRLYILPGTVIPAGTRFYPQVEIGLTPTAYEKHFMEDFEVSWQDEAGNVYGGRVNPVLGKLIVEWAMVTLPDSYVISSSGTPGTTGKYTAFNPRIDGSIVRMAYDMNKVGVYAEAAKGITRAARGQAWEIYVSSETNLAMFVPSDSTPESVAEAIGGTKSVVRLETPIEVDIDPVEVLTLFGVNNVWTGIGSVSVDAPLDTKSHIDRLTQPDNDMVADDNIPSGKYFSVNNKLYLSTAAIARGAAIIPGTNCNETSIPEALNALNQ